jgi:alcohol dehydrogenase
VNLLNSFSFELPTRIEYGLGSTEKLAEFVNELGARKVLLVTDRGIEASGVLSAISDQLTDAHLEFEAFSDVESNPKDHNVHAGAKMARSVQADCLVAIGGGSPIDCAKAIAVLATHEGQVRDYEGRDKISGNVLPLIAIPTTAGTGSEVTFSAVITDTAEGFKFTVKHGCLAPKMAILDPQMTLTMPSGLTAATGMDALTHAIEGYTSRVSEPLADAAALFAIELVTKHLKIAVFEGKNMEARAGMLLGSVLAGIAFSHSDVGSVHCIAEALGGKYDTAHGVCNAVVLPAVMEYNMDYCRERYARIASAMGISYASVEEGARSAVEAVKQLAVDVALPSFSSFGVNKKDVEELANKSFVNGSNIDNPRPMGKEDYLVLFKSMMG